jgi:hypothetical protein
MVNSSDESHKIIFSIGYFCISSDLIVLLTQLIRAGKLVSDIITRLSATLRFFGKSAASIFLILFWKEAE